MRMKKSVSVVLLVIGYLLVLGGCANLYQVDLEGQRQNNLKEDMNLLRAREAMTFPEPLTLSDVIRVGLENNLDMRISKIMGEIADDTSLAEKLKMLPQLNVNGNYSHNSELNIKEYEDLTTGDRYLGNSTSEEKTRRTISAGLSWNILDFGLSYIRARQATVATEIQRMERLRQAQTLALDISAAYWKAVLAEDDLEYIRAMESQVGEYKGKADEMVTQKRLDPMTAKGIEKQMVNLSIAAEKLRADISGMRIELCRLMGLPPATRFTLSRAESFRAYLDNLPPADEILPEKIEEIALKNRPELFSADMQETIQQDEAKAVLVSMFPGISFNATWFYDDNSYLLNNDWTNVGVSLAANLLSIPSKYMQWKAKDKSVTMVKVQRLMLTAGIITQVHMALHDYKMKENQYKLYDRSFNISGDLLDMSKERQDVGKMSDTMVSQRMLENMVTKLERNRSLVDLLNSYNMLLVTLGLDHGRWRESLTAAAAGGEGVPLTTGSADTPADTTMMTEIPAADPDGISEESAGQESPEVSVTETLETGFITSSLGEYGGPGSMPADIQ